MPTIDRSRHTFRPEGPEPGEHGGFYVSVLDRGRYLLALGPFDTHAQAEANVSQVRCHVAADYPGSAWYEFGTSRVTEGELVAGRFNDTLDAVEAGPPAPPPRRPTPPPPPIDGGYLVILDGITYERKGGGTFTLAEAWAALEGVAQCRIARADGTVIAKRGYGDWEFCRPTPTKETT